MEVSLYTNYLALKPTSLQSNNRQLMDEEKKQIQPEQGKISNKNEEVTQNHKENSLVVEGNDNETLSFSKKTIAEELAKANQKLAIVNRGLEFNIHEETNRIYVNIIDKDKDEVIKEIPPSELLDMLAGLWSLAGILIDEKI